ncbi:MAG: hypothetical protein NTU72_05400 [Fimbriimonadales bacterium]|nr:hypothetical protein [Fimbriimonadales bacterium]
MLKVHLRRMLLATLVGGLLGAYYAYQSPKVYEASVQLVAGSPTLAIDPNMPLEVRKVLLPGIMNDLDSDTGLPLQQKSSRTNRLQQAKHSTNSIRFSI